MRISLNWLRDLVDFSLSPEAIAEALTLSGFEVEGIEDRRTWAEGVIVGKILSAHPHPNANKLQVCQVALGEAVPATIVCGAANARPGIVVPVAVPGTYLPAIKAKIELADKRGVTSAGMICSLSELGLEKQSDGIHEFAEEFPLGSDVRPLLGLDDVVLDLTSTANRADALSMVGIAREVAALTRNSLHLPAAPAVEVPPIPAFGLEIANPKHCPTYSGTLITGVAIGPSPTWLKRRLEAAGTRSINNVVDITNFILLEWGQPLHAFDWHRLQGVMQQGSGAQVGVRLAQPGETLKTLDGSERVLHPENLVITAGDLPVALAGVMGGEATEVHPQSVDIFLEAALFDPVAIRRSARAQFLRTEASARYERGVDFSGVTTARDRAVQMILQLAGGKVVGQSLADQRPSLERQLTLRLSRLMDILGDDVRVEDVMDVLPALGFELSPCGSPASDVDGVPATVDTDQCVWQVTVPPYRLRDIEREIDLIEEFARIYGYDHFAATLPAETTVGNLTVGERILRQVREAFRSVGLTELVHSSLCAAAPDIEVVIRNPLSPEFSALRKSLLPGMLEAFRFNWDQGNGPLNGFEVGRVFSLAANGHYLEADHLGGVLGGNPALNNWQHQRHPYDWFAAKGILVAALSRLGVDPQWVPDDRYPQLHPGRTAALSWQGYDLGVLGQVHPRVRQELGLPDEVYLFELDLDVLGKLLAQQALAQYHPFSSYPPSDRDIAFFAPLPISVAELEAGIRDAAGTLVESVALFDEYRGEGVPPGERSLAFRLVYRASDHTLTDAEVEKVQQEVRHRLETAFGVTLRS